jgi:hypothetical protein
VTLNDAANRGRGRFFAVAIVAATCAASASGLLPLLKQSASLGGEAVDAARRLSPAWMKDLIVYEIAPKGFTSPNGPESGTFNSLKARLPYLHDLGITGIWLAGHSLAPPHVYFNVWSQYANLEPDKIEPTLGTPEEFHAMVREAHRQGIKIFLDVHVHGLHPSSTVIAKHPEWFKGDAGGMVDFDWYGNHKDLDEWWINLWTDCIKRYAVDGFRLDISMARADVWKRIRQNAAAIGHEIAIFEEGEFPISGVSDFSQQSVSASALAGDVAGFYQRKFGTAGEYHVTIQHVDGKSEEGRTNGGGVLRVRRDGLSTDKVGRRNDEDRPDGIPDVRLTVENVGGGTVRNVVVQDDLGNQWQLAGGKRVAVEGKPPTLRIYLATLGHGWPCVMLSCHDTGWGLSPKENPYRAQGSRALFGYAVIFTPMIPLFFSGEEFDATYRPIPWLSPNYLEASSDSQQVQMAKMFAAGSPSNIKSQDVGKGRWLYGAMLDWKQLDQPEHRGMFEDVKAMIAVRKREADILAVVPDREKPRLRAVSCQGDIAAPVPYVRWNGRAAIVVVANRDTLHDAHLRLQVPLAEIGLGGHPRYRVTMLWPAGPAKTCSAGELAAIAVVVPCDKTGGGGLRVLKVEPSE